MVYHGALFNLFYLFQISDALSYRIQNYAQEQLKNSETGSEEEEEEGEEEEEEEKTAGDEDENEEVDNTSTPGLTSFMYCLF